MISELFETSKGALILLLSMNIPWILIFIYIVYTTIKNNKDGKIKERDKKKFVRREILWISVILFLFISINLASIPWMPKAEATQEKTQKKEIQKVNVTAQMWNYQISNRTLKANTPVKFKLKSLDTVHSFSVYSPSGDIIFTKMLIPNTKQEFVYTFEKAGQYKVRCLEYCGTGHAYMKDHLVIKK